VKDDYETYSQPDPWLWRDYVLHILSASSGLGEYLSKINYAEPYYGGHAKKWGYSYCFEYPPSAIVPTRGYIMLSRTHIANSEAEARKKKPSLDQLLRELESQVTSIPPEKFGNYHVELDVPGWFGTLECCSAMRTKYYFMLSQAGRRKPYWGFRENFRGLLP